MNRYLIVGAGFSGAVLARELALHTDKRVLVVDERSHVAGNCHTERDRETDVMLHRYGPHIFNTNSRRVWDYIQQFGRFGQFINRVKAKTARGMFSLPINLLTINQFFGKAMNPAEARDFVAGLGDSSIAEPRNFEEQALKFVGRELYETFFYGYTKKQWGCEPRELPASILQRLPVRFTYDDNYYNAAYQGIPEEGYTRIVENILAHSSIEVRLNHHFEPAQGSEFEHVFYTGPVDAYFDFRLGRLGYRTVTFERIDAEGDFQGNAVINYPELSVPYTRVHEHKHFAPWEEHARTVAFHEHSKQTEAGDVPYYPIRTELDKKLLAGYYACAHQEAKTSFLGRLGTYRYLDMDDVIDEALSFAARFLSNARLGVQVPRFSFGPFSPAPH